MPVTTPRRPSLSIASETAQESSRFKRVVKSFIWVTCCPTPIRDGVGAAPSLPSLASPPHEGEINFIRPLREGGRGSLLHHLESAVLFTPNTQMPCRFRYRHRSDSKGRSRVCGNACVPQSSRR